LNGRENTFDASCFNIGLYGVALREGRLANMTWKVLEALPSAFAAAKPTPELA
jgi:hypothetical protein